MVICNMISNVVPFPEKEYPHLSGKAFCSACDHDWEAVAPVGTVLLECPSCGTNKGRFLEFCLPENDVYWECKCGCCAFVVLSNSYMCSNCGIRSEGFNGNK